MFLFSFGIPSFNHLSTVSSPKCQSIQEAVVIENLYKSSYNNSANIGALRRSSIPLLEKGGAPCIPWRPEAVSGSPQSIPGLGLTTLLEQSSSSEVHASIHAIFFFFTPYYSLPHLWPRSSMQNILPLSLTISATLL